MTRELSRRAAAGLLRRRFVTEVGGRINLASNDYLGLARDPRLTEGAAMAARAWGGGATASPLICGLLPIHAELERRLADLKRCASAMVFSSGYAANLGLVASLAGRGDIVFADRLAHASLLDGARLSGSRLVRFRHNDAGHLEELLIRHEGAARRVVVTESVFSMDGDLAPLRDLHAVARRHGAMLVVDEAHATGVYGPGGAGRTVELGIAGEDVVAMGTLSKALGSQGGYVAGTERLTEWLTQSARSYLYSTALCPAAAGAALSALDVLAAEPDRPERLRRRALEFRDRLSSGRVPVPAGDSPIVPLVIGEARGAAEFASRLEAAGVLAVAIRPPTVPPGTSRVRLSVSLAVERERLMEAADRIAAEWRRWRS